MFVMKAQLGVVWLRNYPDIVEVRLGKQTMPPKVLRFSHGLGFQDFECKHLKGRSRALGDALGKTGPKAPDHSGVK